MFKNVCILALTLCFGILGAQEGTAVVTTKDGPSRSASSAAVASAMVSSPSMASDSGEEADSTSILSGKSSQGRVSVRNGYLDAVRATLDLTFPLGPRLPGNIPAGFSWRLQGWAGGSQKEHVTEFRPIVWPVKGGGYEALGMSDLGGRSALSATFLGSNLTFVPLHSNALYPWSNPPTKLPKGEAYPKERVLEWLQIRGVILPSSVSNHFIYSTPDGTGFLVIGLGGVTGYGVVFQALMQGDLAASWDLSNPSVSWITSRWGEKISLTEAWNTTSPYYTATIKNANNNSEWIKFEIQKNGNENIQLPSFNNGGEGFVHANVLVHVTNSFDLAETRLDGFYNDSRANYACPPFANFPSLYPKQIAIGGSTTSFDWGFIDWNALPEMRYSSECRLSSSGFPETSYLSIIYPSGYTESFEGPDQDTIWSAAFTESHKGFWNTKGWFNDPQISHVDSVHRMEYPENLWGILQTVAPVSNRNTGIVKFQSSDGAGNGKTVLITQVVPKVTYTQAPGSNSWNASFSSPDHITNILIYPTLYVDKTTSYQGIRLVHEPWNHVPWYYHTEGHSLFWNAAVREAQEIYGTGSPYSTDTGRARLAILGAMDWDPTGYSIRRRTTLYGWDFRSWYNPSGDLGFVSKPVPTGKRVSEYVNGGSTALPDQTTVLSDFDGWGFNRVDHLISRGDAEKVCSTTAGSPRRWNMSLGVLQQDSTVKSISGPSLGALRRGATSPMTLETRNATFDDQGRVTVMETVRGNQVQREERVYQGKNPSPFTITPKLTSPELVAPTFSGSNSITIGYHDAGYHFRPVSRVDGLTNRTVYFGYNRFGQLTDSSDVSTGIIVRTTYDDRGRVSGTSRDAKGNVGGASTTFTYGDDQRSQTKTVNVAGRTLVTETQFDAFGRVIRVTNPDGSYQTTAYDAWGQVSNRSPWLRITQSSYGNFRFDYDPTTGRLLKEWDAQGRLLKSYGEPYWGTVTEAGVGSATGMLHTVTDDRGLRMTEVRDLLGQRAALLDEAGHLSLFAYDAYGNMVETNNGGQLRKYQYNELGWLLAKEEPEEGLTQYGAFTALGASRLELKKGRDRNGNLRIETILDSKHRPSSIATKDGNQFITRRSVTYRDDFSVPNVVAELQPNGWLSESYGYDDLGRLNQKTVSDGSQSFSINQSLDAAGNVVSLTYPAGNGRAAQTQTFEYDSVMRPKLTKLDGQLRADKFYGSGSGSTAEDFLAYGNGVGTRSVMDKGELVQTEFSYTGGKDRYVIGWTPGGLMTSRWWVIGETIAWPDDYQYDALQRLTYAKTNGLSGEVAEQWFSYDRFGNRTGSDFTYRAGSTGVAKPDELRAWRAAPNPITNDLPSLIESINPGSFADRIGLYPTTSGDLGTGAKYDNWGRMTSVQALPGDAKSNTLWKYDPAGRVVAEVLRETAFTYLLDASGLRFRKASPDGSMRYTIYGFGREPLSVFESAPASSSQALRLKTRPGVLGSTQALRLATVNGVQTIISAMLPAVHFPYVRGMYKAPIGSNVKLVISFVGMLNEEETDTNSMTYEMNGTGDWYSFSVGEDWYNYYSAQFVRVRFYSPGTDTGEVLIDDVYVSSGDDQGYAWNDPIESALKPEWSVTGPRAELVPIPRGGISSVERLVQVGDSPSISGWYKSGAWTSIELSFEDDSTPTPRVLDSRAYGVPGDGTWHSFSVGGTAWSCPQAKKLRVKINSPWVEGVDALFTGLVYRGAGVTETNLDFLGMGPGSGWKVDGLVDLIPLGADGPILNNPNQNLTPVNWVQSNIYGFGTLISEEKMGGTFYTQSDQVQSPSLMTDKDGKVVSRIKNLPFGERFGQTGDQAFFRRYATHEDQPGSAIYMQARTYLPVYGKFAQPDPLYDQKIYNKDSWNLYAYVANNPVTHNDPTGQNDGEPERDYGDDNSHDGDFGQDLWDAASPADLGNFVVSVTTLYQITSGQTGETRLSLGLPAQSNLTGDLNLPENVPPLDVIHEKGGSIDVNGVTKIVEGGASQLPALAGALTYWRGSFNAIFTVSGTSSSDQSGSFNPTSGNININPTLVTSRNFSITRGQVIQTVAHELRHGYQQAQIRQTGQVRLGIARDPKTGQVTWMTMNKTQFEAESRKLGGTSDKRTYALSPIEIDARIFAEWMRRDYK